MQSHDQLCGLSGKKFLKLLYIAAPWHLDKLTLMSVKLRSEATFLPPQKVISPILTVKLLTPAEGRESKSKVV